MEKNDPSIGIIIWEIVKWVLAALGFVISSFGAWLWKMRGDDRAMLKRHDDWIKGTDGELGEQKKFREQLKNQPSSDAMAQDIRELKETDERLHRRISIKQRAVARLRVDMAEVKTHLVWIRKALGDKGNEE